LRPTVALDLHPLAEMVLRPLWISHIGDFTVCIANALVRLKQSTSIQQEWAATVESGYLDSNDLEGLTGTPASTWRYWAHIGTGPGSFKLGRRLGG